MCCTLYLWLDKLILQMTRQKLNLLWQMVNEIWPSLPAPAASADNFSACSSWRVLCSLWKDSQEFATCRRSNELPVSSRTQLFFVYLTLNGLLRAPKIRYAVNTADVRSKNKAIIIPREIIKNFTSDCRGLCGVTDYSLKGHYWSGLLDWPLSFTTFR